MSGERLAAIELEHRLANAEKELAIKISQHIEEAELIVKLYESLNQIVFIGTKGTSKIWAEAARDAMVQIAKEALKCST